MIVIPELGGDKDFLTRNIIGSGPFLEGTAHSFFVTVSSCRVDVTVPTVKGPLDGLFRCAIVRRLVYTQGNLRDFVA